MAFLNRVGSVLKQALSRQISPDLSLSNSSMYQAYRSMSSSKLFIGGLSYGTDETSLREVFNQYGDVVDVRIIMDRDTGRSKGFGFVSFTSTESATTAMQNLDGKDLHGRQIKVNYATERPRAAFGGGGGYGGGGYGGGGYGGGGYGGGGYGGGGYGGGGYGGGGNNSGYSGGGNYNSGYPSGGNYNSGYSGGGNSNSGYSGGGGSGNFSGGYAGGDNYNSGSGGYATTPQTNFSGGSYGAPIGNSGGAFEAETGGLQQMNTTIDGGAQPANDDLDHNASFDGNYRDDDDVEPDDFANTRK